MAVSMEKAFRSEKPLDGEMFRKTKKFPLTRYLWVGWYYLWAGILFLMVILPGIVVSIPLGMAFLSRNRRRNLLHFWRRLWAVLTGIGTGLRFVPVEHPDYRWLLFHLQTPVIFCPTHRSYLDIHALLEIIDVPFAFVAKSELLRNPAFRLFLAQMDVVVDRGNRNQAPHSTREMKQLLRQGISVVIFPEGTIRTGKEIQSDARALRSGAFRLAVDLNIPIVPIRMEETEKAMPDDGRYGGSPRRIYVYFGPPLLPTTYSHWTELRKATAQFLFAHLRNRISPSTR